jgi:hypothetical protein
MFHIPLLILPLILFNLGLAGVLGGGPGGPWEQQVFSLAMISGGYWTMKMSDLMVLTALILLFFEITKSTRTSNRSVVDHLLSTFVFIAFLVEFLLVPGAATSLFFVLMTISLLDVLAGFFVSIRAAGRDVNLL